MNKYKFLTLIALIFMGTLLTACDLLNKVKEGVKTNEVVQKLEDKKEELVKAKVKIFVRRGGPNEAKGLAMMQSFLEKSDLLGSVHGHDIALTQVVTEVKNYLKEDVYPKRTVLKRNSRLQAEKGSSADERTDLNGK